MRIIKETGAFKRDRKHAEKSNVSFIIKQRFMPALKSLANDEALDYSYRDHALTGNWKGSRECHLAFDLVLIYRYDDVNNVLWLERLGSHSEALGL
ncbi:MAG: type II toxin-antitoxin system YafQ family toxin [Synergistaceae bacterium]|nr:type II toxin-antitoxin system YafQ family toxin [Synergistaceae bacterium]